MAKSIVKIEPNPYLGRKTKAYKVEDIYSSPFYIATPEGVSKYFDSYFQQSFQNLYFYDDNRSLNDFCNYLLNEKPEYIGTIITFTDAGVAELPTIEFTITKKDDKISFENISYGKTYLNNPILPRVSGSVYIPSWNVGGSAILQFCDEYSIIYPELVTYADIPFDFQKVETLITIENQ